MSESHQSSAMKILVMFHLAICWTPPALRADNLAVFLALDHDIKALVASGTETGQPILVGTRKIRRVTIGQHQIYVTLMGSGCVETAVSAEALLARYRCDLAFSVGPAGAITDSAAEGTWWKVDQCLVANKAAGEGSASQPYDLESSAEGTTWALPDCFKLANCAKLVSGEQFISSTQGRQTLATVSRGATLVDMNTHGLVVACANHGVPLHVWRIVSDQANENAGESFRNFVSNYNGAGARALTKLIHGLPTNPKAATSYTGIKRLLESGQTDKDGAKKSE